MRGPILQIFQFQILNHQLEIIPVLYDKEFSYLQEQ